MGSPDPDPSTIAHAIATAVLTGPATYPCGLRLVSIDGRAGSGKTTLARAVAELCASLPGPNTVPGAGRAAAGARVVRAVHMDDLYQGWDGARHGARILRERILEPLANGQDAGYERYDWIAEHYAEHHAIPHSTDVLVVEGVLSTDPSLSELLGVTVLVDAPSETCLARGIARDGESMRQFWEAWQAWERPYFDARYAHAAANRQPAADFVVATG